ncbi:MAG: M48 family metalloprotease [Tepidisphaeraceae bacterium]
MKHQMKQRRRIAVAGTTMAAAAVMLALAPLNMGGCSAGSVGDAVGSAVGGTTGQLIGAGGKAVEAAAMNETQEEAMGQSVAVAITNRYGLDADESLNRYVTLVGMTVASGSPRADATFNFGVLNTDQVNAYAGPNGYIMITRGALKQMQDESELAGVLAHEIAHVVDRHGLNKMKQAGFTQAAMQAAKTNGDVAQWAHATDNIVQGIVDGQYNQDQESRADLLAVDYLVASGYDPNGYHAFLRRTASAQASNSSLMSSHPNMGNRAARVATKIQQKGATGGAKLPERFKKNVPGAKPAA